MDVNQKYKSPGRGFFYRIENLIINVKFDKGTIFVSLIKKFDNEKIYLHTTFSFHNFNSTK